MANSATNSNELHVIFGTGPVGSHIASQLLAKGKTVRLISRSGKTALPLTGVEMMRGDATDVNFAKSASRGATVVYFTLNPAYTNWPQGFPPLQTAVLEAASAVGAKLISAENVYMYGSVHAPMTEAMPYNATTRKGRVRAQMANELMAAHKAGKVRVAIGRAGNFYGPGVMDSSVGDRVFYPALEGKKVQLMGNLDMLHSYTYIEDFARTLVTLGEQESALGQVWHSPNAPAITTRQFLDLVFEAAGTTPNFASAPDLIIRGMGLFNPMFRELAEMLYEFNEPHVIDHSKFARAFGDHSTPIREAIRRTLAWFRANPEQHEKSA